MQIKRIKFGNSGIIPIAIYRVTDDGKAMLIDREYTDITGMLRWRPPSTGTYNFISAAHPQYNISGVEITETRGHADSFMCPTS